MSDLKPAFSAANNRKSSSVALSITILTLGAVGVFILPWFFPPAQAQDSLSYVYGFDNRLAWVAVLLSILLLSVVQIAQRRHKPASTHRLALQTLLNFDTPGERNGKLRKVALISTLVAASAAAAWYRILPFSYYGEMSYFVSRLETMILGYSPYSQFDFIYGPGLLYPQLWLYRLASGTLSVEAAHAVIFIAHFVVGLWMVCFVIERLGGKSDRALLFLCLVAPAFLGIHALGLNYTFLRFAAPLFSLILLHTGAIPNKSIVLKAILAFGLTAFCFLISLEIGVAALAAVGFYLVLRREYYAVLGCGLAVPAVLSLAGIPYFAVLAEFAEGAGNFPIYPTLHVMLFLGLLALVLPQLAALEWTAQSRHKGIAGGLFALVLINVPPALGRCDSGHIFFNGLTLLLIALAAAAKVRRPIARKGIIAAYAILFILIPLTSFWALLYDQQIILALRSRLGVIKQGQAYYTQPWMVRVESPLLVLSKPMPRLSSDLEALRKYDVLPTPLGCEPEVERFLKLSGRYAFGYHPNPLGILTAAAFEREFEQVRTMRRVLVPEASIAEVQGPFDEKAYNASSSRFLSTLLFFPVSFQRLKKQPFAPQHQVAAYIREYFAIEERWRENVIMNRKSASLRAAPR